MSERVFRVQYDVEHGHREDEDAGDAADRDAQRALVNGCEGERQRPDPGARRSGNRSAFQPSESKLNMRFCSSAGHLDRLSHLPSCAAGDETRERRRAPTFNPAAPLHVVHVQPRQPLSVCRRRARFESRSCSQTRNASATTAARRVVHMTIGVREDRRTHARFAAIASAEPRTSSSSSRRRQAGEVDVCPAVRTETHTLVPEVARARASRGAAAQECPATPCRPTHWSSRPDR